MNCGTQRLSDDKYLDNLLRYVLNNDEKRIIKIVNTNPDILFTSYKKPYDGKSILHIACNDLDGTECVNADTIRLLIELTVNPFISTVKHHWEPLHYIALNANFNKLFVILTQLSTVQINSFVHCSEYLPRRCEWIRDKNIPSSHTNNALHILLKYGKRTIKYYECIELLIKAGIDVDIKDSNGKSCRDLILQVEDKFLDTLLEKAASSPVLKRNFPDSLEDIMHLTLNSEQANAYDGFDESTSSCTLLQICCTKGLENAVCHLLECGADPNKIIAKNPMLPIMIAVRNDFANIVNLLLSSSVIELPYNILVDLQTQKNQTRRLPNTEKYLALFLSFIRKLPDVEINQYLSASDELHRTPLYYTTYYDDADNTLTLLEMGASLTTKDVFHSTPLNHIKPPVLEKFLDSCIRKPQDGDELNTMINTLRDEKEKFSLEIDYRNLVHGRNRNDKELFFESNFISHLIRIKNLKPYLNHPVIASYLEIKWHKFKWFYYLTFLLYIIAYISILFYGFAFHELRSASNRFLLTSIILIVIREFVYIFVFKLALFENYLDCILIGGMIYILVTGWLDTNVFLSQNLLVAFSIVFLISTFGIFVQLGNIPMFTYKVIILRRITYNFAKYIVFYTFPLLAFAFCFYMLAEKKDNILVQTIYDTVSMFAGDMDRGYPENLTNPIFGHCIYVVFMLFIGIVLQNLLVGLAVSDMQEIQKEAEYMEKKERAKYLSKIEWVLYNWYKNSSNTLVSSCFGYLLRLGSVFTYEPILVIQPFNEGRVYSKDNPGSKHRVNDNAIVEHMQNIFKSIGMDEDEKEEKISLKALHEKIDNLENMLRLLITKSENK